MRHHLITTASLLQAIDHQRADEASNRWDEVSREFMSQDSDASEPTREFVHPVDRPIATATKLYCP